MADDVQLGAALAGRLYVEASANPRSGSCTVESFGRRQASESLRCPNRGGHGLGYQLRGRALGTIGQREILDDDQAARCGREQVSAPLLAEPQGRAAMARKFGGAFRKVIARADGVDSAIVAVAANDEPGATQPEFGGPVGAGRELAAKSAATSTSDVRQR
jgi:hypothetical protein